MWDLECRVIGVVGDVKDAPTDSTAEPAFFWAHAQRPFRAMAFAVCTSTAPLALVETIRREVRLDRELPVANVCTVDEVVAARHAYRRFLLAVVASFAALTLTLAVVGAYGVLAYSVHQRKRELGIRVALGARRSQVFSLIIAHGLRLTGAGIALGAVVGVGLGRLGQSLLFGISPTDPPTFVAAGLAVALAASVASAIPAMRATRAQPVEVLRAD